MFICVSCKLIYHRKLTQLCHEKTIFLHIWENNGADQLRINCAADQRLCLC